MKIDQLLFTAAFVTATLGLGVQELPAQEPSPDAASVKILGRSGDYCHMKFPAIREETLSAKQPMLKDADSDDLIDFYGPCDHDPTGSDEIQAQQLQMRRRRYGNIGE
jgi:hypothetical protein